MITGLAAGVLLSLAITLVGAAILAKLIDAESLREENIGYSIMILLILSSAIGAMVALLKIRRRNLLVCMISPVLYWISLMTTTALFFGGQYSAAAETLAVILGGGLFSFFLLSAGKGRGGKRKIRIPNR